MFAYAVIEGNSNGSTNICLPVHEPPRAGDGECEAATSQRSHPRERPCDRRPSRPADIVENLKRTLVAELVYGRPVQEKQVIHKLLRDLLLRLGAEIHVVRGCIVYGLVEMMYENEADKRHANFNLQALEHQNRSASQEQKHREVQAQALHLSQGQGSASPSASSKENRARQGQG
jgi:hypothetical protein